MLADMGINQVIKGIETNKSLKKINLGNFKSIIASSQAMV